MAQQKLKKDGFQSSFFAIAGWVIGYITNKDFGK